RIWDGFLKRQSSLPEEERINILNGGEIDGDIQSAGILFASNDWFNKLPEEPGGNSRQNLVEKLGIHLNDKMMKDMSMSYPGGNGISIALSEYNADTDDVIRLRNFMNDMVDFGVLFETEHSSKSKKGGRRIKFYPHPILCPRFQLPEARTKEPYYWKIDDLFKLVESAQVSFIRTPKKELLVDSQNSFDFDGN
ncbi:hypothetical protein KA005_32460, partial [bacterium]|nr:hypothetical protein [bacterium]